MAEHDVARPAPAGGPGPTPRATWRVVAVPTEHGGWGLTLEPVLLGLLVRWTTAGVAIGVVALLAFVARTPLKVVLVDRHRHRVLERTRVAARIFAVEALVLVAALAIAFRFAAGPFWLPLLVATPLVGIELWFDRRSRSRRLLPELAGTIGIGSVGAAIVFAGGGSGAVAAGAWAVVAARAVASIPFVRHQLARAKGQPTDERAVLAAHAAALVVAVAAVLLGWLPVAAVVAIAVLVAIQVVLARVPPPPRAAIVGVQQLILGLAVVVVTALALR